VRWSERPFLALQVAERLRSPVSFCRSCAGIWTAFAAPRERGLVFVGPKGAPLRRSNFRPIWNAACEQARVPGLHFHDLRHVGGTLAAATGASLKELMARLGHSSTRAAIIYQHATRDRDEAIAKALGGLMHQVQSDHAEQAGEGP
jgi:integrase